MDENKEKNLVHEDEQSKLLIDHSYDGIQELDNRPPPWLMWLFYITVVFSALYFGYYHWFGQGDLQEAEYQAELAEAEKQMEKRKAENPEKYSFDENNIQLVESADDLTAGKELYDKNGCAACHGAAGEGNAVGPNLTDEYWINGGTPNDVFKVIKHGNTAKGMMAYKDKMTNEELLKLASFILKEMVGSNPPNAKEPQGDKVQ